MQPRSEHEQLCRDVRGTLINILGYLEVLQEGNPPSEVTIQKAIVQAGAAIGLIDEFMLKTCPGYEFLKK